MSGRWQRRRIVSGLVALRWLLDVVVEELLRLASDGRYRMVFAAAVVLLGAAWLGQQASLLLAAAPYGLVGVALVWLRPALAVPALLLGAAFLPLEIGTGTGSSVNAALLGVMGLTGLWLMRMVLLRELRLVPSHVNLPWMALIAVAGVSILAGSALWDPRVIVKSNFILVQFAQWAVFGLSACAFWLTGNYAPDRRVLWWLVCLVLVLGVVFLTSLVVPPLAALQGKLLFRGPIFRICFVALAAGLALYMDRLGKLARLGLLAAAIAMIVLPRQLAADWQSGWLPPLVTLLALCAIRLGRGLTRSALLVGSLVSAPLAGLLLPESVGIDLWSLETRLIAWRGLLSLMPGHWLFGLGLAAYWHYWRDVNQYFAYLDPTTGWLHYTYEPRVNMHNNYVDVFGQMGLLGVLALGWLLFALVRQIRQEYVAESEPFGRAYVAACGAALVGMVFAGMLADWVFPFVYNIGLRGFRDSLVGWLMLGGVVTLAATRARRVV